MTNTYIAVTLVLALTLSVGAPVVLQLRRPGMRGGYYVMVLFVALGVLIAAAPLLVQTLGVDVSVVAVAAALPTVMLLAWLTDVFFWRRLPIPQ